MDILIFKFGRGGFFCRDHYFDHGFDSIHLMITKKEKFGEIQERGREHQTPVRTNYNFPADDDDDDDDDDYQEDWNPCPDQLKLCRVLLLLLLLLCSISILMPASIMYNGSFSLEETWSWWEDLISQ